MPHPGSGRTIVVLTALPLEFEAVQRLLPPSQTSRDGGVFHETVLVGTGHRIVLAVTGQGNHNGAVVTERAIAACHPDIMLLVGIAGALHDDLEPGDVIVPAWVHAYHGGMSAEAELSAAPRGWSPDRRLHDRARVTASRQPDPSRVKFRTLASGEHIVNGRESGTRQFLDRHYADTAAVDTESAGFLLAVQDHPAEALVIRGISDRADGTKHQTDKAGHQVHAAAAAANFTVRLLHDPGLFPTGARQQPPRPVPPELAGSWDGGSQGATAGRGYSFSRDGYVRFRHGDTEVEGTVVVENDRMTICLPNRQPWEHRWSIDSFEVEGYRFSSLLLDGFSYVRQD